MNPNATKHTTTPAPSPNTGANPADAPQLTPRQERLRDLRHAKLNQFHALVSQGYTTIAAASEIGCARSTFWKWEQRFQERGLAGLVPNISKGSPPLIPASVYTAELVQAVQKLACVFGSAKAGGLAFAKTAQCPTALADYITKRKNIPEELRRRVGFKRRPLPCRTAGSFVRIEGIPHQIAA